MTTQKQEVWLEEYFKCGWNATEAARRAGYAQPNKRGPELKQKFAEEIQARIDEKAMSADEVLLRLAAQARGDMADFLKFEEHISHPFLDMEGAKKKGLLSIVKKFKYSGLGFPEIELYDAQAALALLGKHHGLFADRVEHSGPAGGAIPVEFVDYRSGLTGQDDITEAEG